MHLPFNQKTPIAGIIKHAETQKKTRLPKIAGATMNQQRISPFKDSLRRAQRPLCPAGTHVFVMPAVLVCPSLYGLSIPGV